MNPEINIAGFSGRFPESANVEEFKRNLFDGVDMTTDDDRRWPKDLLSIPSGKLKDLTTFDASFFGIHSMQTDVMAPELRILLEVVYEAIIDAGVNPADLRGSNTGVFIGVSCFEKSNDIWTTNPEDVNRYRLQGTHASMYSNRISYNFDLKGPSFIVDTACSSSLVALHSAVQAIRAGECNGAIVGGVHVNLCPSIVLEYQSVNMLSPEGKCKSFDAEGNGFARAEAVVALLLQKSEDAKRVYATIINSNINNDGYKDKGITYPSSLLQYQLLKQVYSEAGIDPKDISYIEAHGTGTPAGDPQEVKAIAQLCENRQFPLYIGSVKSNMGHAETASGLCSIAKMLIAMETGEMPGNLHFKTPNPKIPAICNDLIKVVTKSMIWEGSIVGVSSFGFGGTNSHVILKRNPNIKLNSGKKIEEGYAKIVSVSGRTKEACEMLLNKVIDNKKDNDFISLIHNIHRKNIHGHQFRGYSVLGKSITTEVEKCQSYRQKRPVWFLFSGVGTQWPGMGKNLLEIKVFESSLQRCAKVLKEQGIDLIDLFLNSNNKTFDNVINCLVMITAIQIGLVDILVSLDIKPDGVVGLSVGELACAYADGSLSLEQTIVIAYWRGKCIMESEFVPGAMAVVGMTWEETAKICPHDVDLAVNLTFDSVTVSGPEQSVEKFVDYLNTKNVFAKIINSSRVAFHSRLIEKAGLKLKFELENIISSPKPRSEKWLSTSIAESAWNTPAAKLSNPEYFVNNLLRPVHFYETIKHIPYNAIIIEIGPQWSLRTIMTKTLPQNCTHIGLYKNDSSNNLEFMLSSIGKLYNAGAQPNLAKLYPSVNFPVSRGTPMLNSSIGWDHSTKWFVPDYYNNSKNLDRAKENVIVIDISKEEYKYLAGHSSDKKIIFPATGYLVLVWKRYAELKNKEYEKLPVIFENVFFSRLTFLSEIKPVKFVIKILNNGNFELSEEGSNVVTGNIKLDLNTENIHLPHPVIKRQNRSLLVSDENVFYTTTKFLGFDLSGVFRSVKSWNNVDTAELHWKNNWITFLDGMIQVHSMTVNSNYLLRQEKHPVMPIGIPYLAINPIKHLVSSTGTDIIITEVLPNHEVIKSRGVEMRGIKYIEISRQHDQRSPNHEIYEFVPYENLSKEIIHQKTIEANTLSMFVQIIAENINALKIRGIEFSTSVKEEIGSLILNIFDNVPLVSCDFKLAIPMDGDSDEEWNYGRNREMDDIKIIKHDIFNSPVADSVHFIIATNVLSNQNTVVLSHISNSLAFNGYVILVESGIINTSLLKNQGLVLVAKHTVLTKSYLLLTKEINSNKQLTIPIIVTEKNYDWIEKVKLGIKMKQKIVLVSQGEITSGLIGFANSIKKESDAQLQLQYVFIQDETAPKFSITDSFYATQLEKQLFANVFKDNQWGSYRYRTVNTLISKCSELKHAYVNTMMKGHLSSLTWMQSPITFYKSDDILTKKMHMVYYAPLNFRDVMLATGQVSAIALTGDPSEGEYHLGLEFVGRDANGRRVMGMVPSKGLATSVLVDSNSFLWEVPQKWSMEQAATIPLCYVTSYYALIICGNLQKGESVLIHSGAGGVGLASIFIALKYGCKIFTTVGTKEKREFLKKRFPHLTDRNIGNSRDTSFEQMVLNETDGHGVDVVLNSLAGTKFQSSVRCLATNGRFLEVGKINLSNNSMLGIDFFLKNTSFHGILVDDILRADPSKKYHLKDLVQKGILNGEVNPLPATVYKDDHIEDAFRFMATGKHIGKVMIQLRNEETRDIKIAPEKTVTGYARTYMDPSKCYILVGGLGGFGLQLANWMISRGAKYIVLTSRSGIKTGYQSLLIDLWKKKGIKVGTSTEDITSFECTERLLLDSSKLAPIGGIVNLAGVLHDNLLENLDANHFKVVTKPKIEGTRMLDVLSRKHCPKLDFFIVMSSISCRGSPGQTNYAFANSSMEMLVEQRRAAGFPAFAIQWGPIGDVGMFMEIVRGDKNKTTGGCEAQSIASCLATMDLLFQNDVGCIVSSCVLGDKKKINEKNIEQVGLAEHVALIMGIKDFKTVEPSNTLIDLGLDSLVSTEIKQTLERCYDIKLSSRDIGQLTLTKLREMEKSTK